MLKILKVVAFLALVSNLAACSQTVVSNEGAVIATVSHGTTVRATVAAPAAAADVAVATTGGGVRCGAAYNGGAVKIGPDTSQTGRCNMNLWEADLAAASGAILAGATGKVGYVRATFMGGGHSPHGGCENLKTGDTVFIPVFVSKYGKATYQAWSKACTMNYVHGRVFS